MFTIWVWWTCTDQYYTCTVNFVSVENDFVGMSMLLIQHMFLILNWHWQSIIYMNGSIYLE